MERHRPPTIGRAVRSADGDAEDQVRPRQALTAISVNVKRKNALMAGLSANRYEPASGPGFPHGLGQIRHES